jgi:hypothetical protein
VLRLHFFSNSENLIASHQVNKLDLLSAKIAEQKFKNYQLIMGKLGIIAAPTLFFFILYMLVSVVLMPSRNTEIEEDMITEVVSDSTEKSLEELEALERELLAKRRREQN